MALDKNKKATRERTARYKEAKKEEDPKFFAKKAKVYREKVKRELDISDSSDSSGQENQKQVNPKAQEEALEEAGVAEPRGQPRPEADEGAAKGAAGNSMQLAGSKVPEIQCYSYLNKTRELVVPNLMDL
jgi:hypothetical protein